MGSKDDLDAVENKIPNVSGFLLTNVFNSKITEVENKIPDFKNLANKTEVTAVENKIPDVSNLVTKSDYAVEITKIKNQYVTNAALDTRHKDLVQKTTFESELKKVDGKVSKNSSNVLSYEYKLKQREDTVNDLERDASYFRGKNYFGDDGIQNYFVFQYVYKYFNMVINGSTVYAHCWQSREISNGKLNARGTTACNDESPVLKFKNNKLGLQFTGDILRQNKVTFDNAKVVNIYIVYKLSSYTSNTDLTLKDCLFGAVKVINSDVDKYKYSGYRICFDSRSTFTS